MAEVWRDVPGYEGLYQVNAAGQVWSRPRLSAGVKRPAYTICGRLLKPWRNSAGYLCVTLCKDGRKSKWLMHRLVASAFIPNPENHPIVNHINGDKADNRVGNLEWCSDEYNAWHNAHTLKHESTLAKRAVVCLDDGKVYDSAAEAARATGGHNQNIVKCCQGKRSQANGLRWAYAEEVQTNG